MIIIIGTNNPPPLKNHQVITIDLLSYDPYTLDAE